jgi:hypothetical protein
MKNLGLSLVAVSALSLAGCQTNVPKEDMDAIGKWSIAMCECSEKSGAEAKTCAAALKKPTLEHMSSSGRPKYKLDSELAYTEIESRGDSCEAKIPK